MKNQGSEGGVGGAWKKVTAANVSNENTLSHADAHTNQDSHAEGDDVAAHLQLK
jgi:hypothetical protein